VTGPATGGLLTCFGDAKGNQTPLAPENLGDTKWNAQMLSHSTGPIATLSAPRTYGVSFKVDY